MVNIYLADTGQVQTNFGTTTAFTAWGSATETQRTDGEFKVSNVLTMKVTAINFGISTQNQDTPNINNIQTNFSRISVSPIKFSLTGELLKQTNYNITTDTKDISSLRDLALMSISKGHKDLYVDDTAVPAREALMSLYQLAQDFGVEDDGSGSTQRHLNVRMDSFSLNESTKKGTYTINFTLLWDFSDVA